MTQNNLRVIFSSFVFVLLTFLIARPFFEHEDRRPLAASKSKHPKHPKQYHAPKRNIWAELSATEAEDLLNFLHGAPNELNLTLPEKATAWDNKVVIVESLAPNKTDAVKYLEGSAEAPPRYARVLIDKGASEEAGLYEYMVGPLPSGPDTTISPLLFPYNSGRNFVRNPLPDYETVVEWFVEVGEKMSDLFEDLLGEVMNPGHQPFAPTLMALSRPAAFVNGTVTSWAAIHGPGLRFDDWALLPQGMYCRFNITGRDPEQWTINEWYYNSVLYESTKAFRSAWESGKVKKQPLNRDGEWSAAQPDEEGIDGRDMTAPVMIQPYDLRYNIDVDERFVSWMGFEFYLSTKQATAMSLWDIKFKGDQVMYELGLQEAMAHYAGNDPMQIGMAWLDTLFGMGYFMYELVPGYDCPQYATFMPITFSRGGETITRNNSICVFEYTADHPLQRHMTPWQLSISRNTYLVVRSVTTAGNYDYTIDYLFFLDGTIEVKVRASGYIFGAYHALEAARNEFNEKRDSSSSDGSSDDSSSDSSSTGNSHYEYGYRVRDVLMTSMHDHVINFKADLDVAGPTNTLYRIGIEPYTHQYPWDDSPRNTMRLQHSPITAETGLDWPPNAAAMYVVASAERNAWGERRGYRITPGTGMGTPPHLTIQSSTALGKAASWATRDLWVLRQHDAEPRSASEHNGMEPGDPLVDFAKMVDGEGIQEEDLVVFFNLGTHHVPHSGDVPNTLMHTSGTSVMFVPHNFHDRDPSRAAAQGVRLDMKGPRRGSEVKYYGATYRERVKVDVEELEPDLTGYNAPETGFVENPSSNMWKSVLLSWNFTRSAGKVQDELV